MLNNLFQSNEKKILISVLFKVSNIIYHDLQKEFVTNIVNEALSNIIDETYSDSNSGTIFLNKNNILNNFFSFYVRSVC